MKMLKRAHQKGMLTLRIGALLGLIAASVITAQAQTTVDERLAALEARIQQLEHELAAAKAAPADSASLAKPVSRTGDSAIAPYIRPAVLTTAEPPATLSAEPAQAAAAPSPEERIKDLDFDALGFFKGTKMSGLLDVYYLYNFNKPSPPVLPFRNFDQNAKSITLNLAELSLAKAVSPEVPIGYNLTFAVGPTADLVNGSDPVNPISVGPVTLNGSRLTGAASTKILSTSANFLQYYISGRVPIGRGLVVDVGKWVTPFGAEVIETPTNWNYSRSLLFTLAIPYYHFGVRATYPLSDKASVGFHVVNGWNNVIDNNGAKTYGFMLGLTPSSHFSLVQTWMGGPEQAGENSNFRHTYNMVMTIPSKMVSFMTDFVYGHEAKAASDGSDVMWYGTAAYLKFQMGPKFALIPRFEWFKDADGFTTGTVQNWREFTLTPEIAFNEHLLTRFEYRRDWSTGGSFARGPAESGKSQDTLSGGMMLKF